jgi:MazG family protein
MCACVEACRGAGRREHGAWDAANDTANDDPRDAVHRAAWTRAGHAILSRMDASQPTAKRPAPTRPDFADPRVAEFARLLAVVDRLRADDGCPWDKKQTLASTVPHLIEEAHELQEAVEGSHDAHVAEEAGDALMNVLLLARIAQDERRFDLADIARSIADKLVRRHPHVFADAEAHDAEAVLRNWEAIKKEERQGRQEDASALAGVPQGLPALQRAARISGKAITAGFRWRDVSGAHAKVHEEVRELDEALGASGLGRDAKAPATAEERAAVEHELGDVLIAAAFLAKYLDMDPEALCRAALRRFEARFRAMEASLPRPMAECGLDEMMAHWRRAKEG